jgi:hypothetical protein
MPTREELLALVDAKSAEAAIQQIAREAEANRQNYYEMGAAGRFDDAAYHLREAWRLDEEARKIAASVQPQQPQSQYTEMEQELLRDYPQIARDPKKWQTALVAANNLIMRGYDRNSPEYAQTIAHACGVLNADFSESNETNTPDTALAACQSKYGPVTVEEYNRGVERLILEKRAGMRPNSQ